MERPLLPPDGLNALDRGAAAPAPPAAREIADPAVREYLRRIGVHETRLAPDLATLERLQRAAIESVTFEDLSMHDGSRRGAGIDARAAHGMNADGVPDGAALARTFDKVVRRGRGGFCFELCPLFCWALRGVGFAARLLKMQVNVSQSHAAGADWRVPTHAAPLVTLAGGRQYLADVGFGRGSLTPVRVDAGAVGAEQREGGPEGRLFRVTGTREALTLELRAGTAALGVADWTAPCWYPRLRWDWSPWSADDFDRGLARVLGARDSWFVCTLIAIRQTRTHAHVLLNHKLAHTELATGRRTVERLDEAADPAAALRAALERYFETPTDDLAGRVTVPA